MYEDSHLESDYEDNYTFNRDVYEEDYAEYLDSLDDLPNPDIEDETDEAYFSDGTPIPDEPFVVVAFITYDPETDELLV